MTAAFPCWSVIVPTTGPKRVIDRRKVTQLIPAENGRSLEIRFCDADSVTVTRECGRLLLHAIQTPPAVIDEMLPPVVAEPPAVIVGPQGSAVPLPTELDAAGWRSREVWDNDDLGWTK